jgi:hypothetical protein
LSQGETLSIIAESNERVAAAQRRLVARQERLHKDFRVLKDSWGATLTQPLVLGGALLGGFMLSGRSSSAPTPVQCECKTRGPTLVRSMVTALLVPMIEKWIGAARQETTETGNAGPVESASTTEAPAQP